ncbi:MAG: CapA family protein [Algoriphagus aquaeductus]|uniref:CapA family protein n=1 Tax=Algoriphagus aquaeductus TaxID=475299 RepID=UPI00391DA473
MVRVSFLGDISLNGRYLDFKKNDLNPFYYFEKDLEEKDFVIGNLECLPKGNFGENMLKRPRLASSIETYDFLKFLNLKVATLAHNHVYDHLDDGFIKACDFLKNNDIFYLGASLDSDLACKPLIVSKSGINIGLINFVTEDTNIGIPDTTSISVNLFNLDKVKNSIGLIRDKVDHIVCILHWGGRVEGGLFPDWEQPKLARKILDFGADLIVGHHSHTVQPFEIYKGKYIFYSLGNFCFSDFIFDNKFYPLSNRRRITFILNVEFNKSDYKIDYDIYKNYFLYFRELKFYKYKFYLRSYFYRIFLRNRFIWKIYFIYLKKIYPFVSFLFRNDLSIYSKFNRLLKYLSK